MQCGTQEDLQTYGSLYTAIAEAKDNDVIGIQGTITIPAIVRMLLEIMAGGW